MQQAQREAQQNELANRLYAESIGEGGEIDYGKLMQGMAQGGMASRIPGVLEQRAATQSRASERQLREEQIRNQQLDAAYKMLKAATPENYAQLRAMGISRAPALANVLPEQFDQRVIDALTGQMEQYFAVQPGGQVFSRRTGQAVGEQVPFKPERPAAPPAPEAKTATRKDYEAAVAEGFQGSFLEYKMALARAGRPPAQPRPEPAPSIAQVQDPTNPDRMLTVDARRYTGGGLGSLGVIGSSGKAPAAQVEANKREEGVSQFKNILDDLRAAYDELDRLRAVPSQQRNVISNVLSSIAASGPGQVVGRAGATEAQTQRDIIASARNQLFAAVKNATGMSAQQLNSNIEFTTWLNSLTDPSRSYQTNMEIIDNLERFVDKSKRQEPRTSGAAPAGRPSLQSIFEGQSGGKR
jgi:hypothetical protein